MTNKILNELAGCISDMSAKLTQIQKCINVLANEQYEEAPSSEYVKSNEDFEDYMTNTFGISSETNKKNHISDVYEEYDETDNDADKDSSEDCSNKWMYANLCERFPLLRMVSFANDMIPRIYEFFRYFEVDSVPVCTCHTEDKERKFVFKAVTPQKTTICMCIDFGSDAFETDGIRINITIISNSAMRMLVEDFNWNASSYRNAVRDTICEEVHKVNPDMHDIGLDMHDIGLAVNAAVDKYLMTPVSHNAWNIDDNQIGISYSLIFKLLDNCEYDASYFFIELHRTVSILLNYFMQLTNTLCDIERRYMEDTSKKYHTNVEKRASEFYKNEVKKKCIAHKGKRASR